MSAEAKQKPLLRVENLAVAFSAVAAVKGVSFDLQPGEILGIVGESGSGKSVTCRALMGLLPGTAQAAGSVRLDGRELLDHSEADWNAIRGRDMGMIFQNPASHLDPTELPASQEPSPRAIAPGAADRQVEADPHATERGLSFGVEVRPRTQFGSRARQEAADAPGLQDDAERLMERSTIGVRGRYRF